MSAGNDRYSRQVLHWGREKQRAIEAAVVLVAGVGGLGATVSQLLVRAGVRTLYLVDDGVVDWPDLHRQLLYVEEDIGRSKLASACDFLRAMNHTVEIIPLSVRIDETFTLPAEVTVVADCLDNFQSRFYLDAALPDETYLVHAGLSGEEGQVMTLQKGMSQSLSEIFAGLEQPDSAIPVTGDAAVVVAGLMTNELFNVFCAAPKLLNRCLVLSLSDFHTSFVDL